jgi:hypothetical protein
VQGNGLTGQTNRYDACDACNVSEYQDEVRPPRAPGPAPPHPCNPHPRGQSQSRTGRPVSAVRAQQHLEARQRRWGCSMRMCDVQVGMFECKPAPKGAYAPFLEMPAALPCPNGTYNDAVGATECTWCVEVAISELHGWKLRIFDLDCEKYGHG